jgi:alpha-L-fucosidase
MHNEDLIMSQAGSKNPTMTRRRALRLIAATPALVYGARFASSQQTPTGIDLTSGRYAGTRESLKAYSIPEWFGDAKFGIWSHWGPQSAVGDGDWYARNMYMEGSAQYEYHLKRFGPQSKVGYKDVIPLFTADKWDPEHLMDLYVKAGAKYFFSMGVHHDNFDMWNSKYQPRWNAVAAGPKKDIVGMWAAAARERGLRFGVSEHLSNSFDWYAPAHMADTKGPFVGVPYDGCDPAFADLYHDYTGMPADFTKTAQRMGRVAPDIWKLQYFRRIKDLIDQHQPDLLYTDGGIPFDEYGLSTVAELYNMGPKSSNGDPEAIYFSKAAEDCEIGTCTMDHERSVLQEIAKIPWQTDTCIGGWHYKDGAKYKTAKKVIDMLVDIVSKNGNLLLNFPLPASGELDAEEMKTLEGITQWMRINSEGIYGTRPWKIYGEGPATKVVIAADPKKQFDPNEGKKPDLGAADIRFTVKGQSLYAFIQGWPDGELVIATLGSGSPQRPAKVVDVRLLGRDVQIPFVQDANGLRVTLKGESPTAADIGVALRVRFA